MKTPVIFFGLLFLSQASMQAQGVFNTSLNESLSVIISETPNGFANIKGDLKYSRSGAKHYQSKVEIEDAVECMVSLSEKEHKGIWNAIILETSVFEEAEYRYRTVFDEISKTIIRPAGEKPYILHGEFSKPRPDMKTVYSRFSLLPSSGKLKNVVVMLALEYESKIFRLSIHVLQEEEYKLADAGY